MTARQKRGTSRPAPPTTNKVQTGPSDQPQPDNLPQPTTTAPNHDTDPARLLAQLRQSEARYRQIIDASPMGIHFYKLESDNRLVFCGANPAANTILGIHNSTFIGKTIEEAFPPLAQTDVPTHYRDVIRTGQPWLSEQINYADGKIRGAFLVSAFRTAPDSMAASFLDITDQLRAQAELKDARQRTDLYREQIPLAVIEWNIRFEVGSWNPAATRIFGYQEQEALGRHASFIVPDESRKSVHDVWIALLTRSGGIRSTNENLRKDGRLITCNWYNTPLVDAKGQVIGVVSLVEDISKQVQAEQALETLMLATSAVTGHDFFNAVVRRLAEWTRCEYCAIAELTGNRTLKSLALSSMGTITHNDVFPIKGTPSDFIFDRDFCIYPTAVRRLFPSDPQLAGLNIDGYAGATLRDKQGRPIGVLYVASSKPLDLPVRMRQVCAIIASRASAEIKREHAEEQVRQLNEELEDKVRQRTAAIEAFSHSVSHDLRAPLRAMDGFSAAVLDDYGDKLDAEGRNHLLTIRQAAQQMGRLIDSLLKLSQLSKAQPQISRVDLSTLATTLFNDLRRATPHRTVSVTVEPGLVANGDPELLQNLLTNLIENAWKFTANQPDAQIEFASDRQLVPGTAARQPVFHIRDNGVGFDMTYANKLFGVFQRLHSAKDYPGTGMGLATCQRIVEMHHGTIWAEAAPNSGATFFFTLHHSNHGASGGQHDPTNHPAR